MLPQRLLLPLVLFVGAFLVAGCSSSRGKKGDYEVAAVRFMIEAGENEAGTTLRLPRSGTVIRVLPRSFFTEYDVTKAEVLDNELGKSLLFQFTQAATRDLFRQTVSNQGRRIVTVVNGMPIGATQVNRPISEGYIFTYVEVEDDQVAKLAKDITRTSEDARKELEKRK